MSETHLVEIDVRVNSDDLGDRPLEVLSAFARGLEALDQKLHEFVQTARHAGASWNEIGAALGMTKQSAWKRFG